MVDGAGASEIIEKSLRPLPKAPETRCSQVAHARWRWWPNC